jgi:hypothetical protein
VRFPTNREFHENFNFFENSVSSFPEKEVTCVIDAHKRRMPLSNTLNADYPGEESSFAAATRNLRGGA